MNEPIRHSENTLYELKDQILKNVFSNIPSQTTISKNSKTGIIVETSPEFEERKYHINTYLRYGKYDTIISDFYEILESYFEHCNLSSFYRNMKDLTITKKKRTLTERIEGLIKGVITTAIYDERLNTIYIVDEKDQNVNNIISF